MTRWPSWQQRLCKWHENHRTRINKQGGGGEWANLPVAPRPPLLRSYSNTGKARSQETGHGGVALQPSQDERNNSSGIVVHNTVPGQEAGYDLPLSGKSGGVVGSRLYGASGSNYPAVRLRAATMVPSLCTSSAAYSREARGLGRPDSVRTRHKLPTKLLVRSKDKSLSVLESSQTIYGSLHHANGVIIGPASIDNLLEVRDTPYR